MPDSPRIAGVRFRNAGKIFYFDTAGMRLDVGEHVIVETARGPELARVVIAPDQVVVNELGREDLKPILRLATDADITKMDELQRRASELLPEARRLAEEARLRAHIEAAEFTLDGRRLTFSFTSEERLDYREFVRAAARYFGVKADMHQLGARDRAKLAGGYGICGRELCCSNWLTTFPSISIRMAKEQDLPLNPQKISGLCGRLLCCLSYEEDGYKQMRKSLPKIGQRCSTPTGEGKAIAVNILRRQVTLLIDGQRVEVPDRDLGTVVRWDSASKIGEPPPSMSRAEAIAQGLIEADEIDLNDAAGTPVEASPYEPGTGRGRLPVPAARREARPRDFQKKPAPNAPKPEETPQPRQQQAPEPRSSRGRRDDRKQQPGRQAPSSPLPQGRMFRRADDAKPARAGAAGEQAPSPKNEKTPDKSERAGRRRNRRGGQGPQRP